MSNLAFLPSLRFCLSKYEESGMPECHPCLQPISQNLDVEKQEAFHYVGKKVVKD